MNTSWVDLLFRNTTDFTAFNTSSSEGSILAATVPIQPILPPKFFEMPGKALRIKASGIISCTSTPTIIFQARLGTTSGSAYLSGTSVGISTAITMASGITNKKWDLELDLICNTPGIGSGNCTLSCNGNVWSPGGFASPFMYALEPTSPDTATWTATLDMALAQYFNLSATWNANSSSNTITCKALTVLALN